MRPMQFTEALDFIRRKRDKPSDWSAADWAARGPEVRQKAFWVSRVESARFLSRSHNLIQAFITREVEQVVGPDGITRPALKTASRAQFVDLMRNFMIKEGMASKSEFKRVNQKDVRDIRSMARLRLIMDTNVRQAHGYGQWKQGMTPAALAAFPAARLIRERGVKEPRPRHQQNLGEVLLKTDPRWAQFHNAREIGGFEVPWGPYGFNSGCTQEDVSAREAKRLGLKVDNLTPIPSNSNDGVSASVRNMPAGLRRRLVDQLRNGPKPRSPKDAARRAALDTRRIMLKRGLDQAELNGDTRKAARYRNALSIEQPTQGVDLTESNEEIKMVTPTPDPNRAGTDITGKFEPEQGTSVDDAAILNRATAAIDSVHGDGPIPQLPFQRDLQSDALAYYQPYTTPQEGPTRIALVSNHTPEFSTIHEIGHVLDHRGFGQSAEARKTMKSLKTWGDLKGWGSYGPEMKGFISAARKTKAFKTVTKDRRLTMEQRDYYGSNHEVFARAYAQWVAKKSGNPSLMAQVEKNLDLARQGMGPAKQWEWDDFDLMEKELDEIFKKRQWMRK